MHHFVAETAQLESGTASGFVKQAETLYEENLQAYVKIVLRRPFSKLIVRPLKWSARAMTVDILTLGLL